MVDSRKASITVEVWSNNMTQSPFRKMTIEAQVDGKVVINAQMDRSGLRALHCEMATSLEQAKQYVLAYQAVIDKAENIKSNWDMIESEEIKAQKGKNG